MADHPQFQAEAKGYWYWYKKVYDAGESETWMLANPRGEDVLSSSKVNGLTASDEDRERIAMSLNILGSASMDQLRKGPWEVNTGGPWVI